MLVLLYYNIVFIIYHAVVVEIMDRDNRSMVSVQCDCLAYIKEHYIDYKTRYYNIKTCSKYVPTYIRQRI